MFQSLFDMVTQAIQDWIPKEKYPTEGKYVDDLGEFLRRKLKRREDAGSYILGSGSSEEHVVQKEAGRHLADIGIDNKIGIELKLNLKKKRQMDTLVGQVEGFLEAYSYVIVVLCGDVEQEKIDVLKHRFRKITDRGLDFLGGQQKVIKIISKASKSLKNESQVTKDTGKSLSDIIFGTS